jgi:hypothetical protein
MAIITLQDAYRSKAAITLCDMGADTLRGDTRPGAWVAVSIKSIGTCTPDAAGLMLHAQMNFANPTGQAKGKRRQLLGSWVPEGHKPNDPIVVSFDQGCGWVGTPASIWLVGGTNGDQYDVTISAFIPRDETDPERVIDVYEGPFKFRLTHYFVNDEEHPLRDFPTNGPGLAYHQWLKVKVGAATVTLPTGTITVPPGGGKLPLSAPPIQVSTGIYVTKGKV